MRIESSARTAQIQTQRQNQMVLQTLRVVTQSSTELCETLAAEAAGNDFLLLRWPQSHRAQAHPGAEDAADDGPGLIEHVMQRLPRLVPDACDRPLALGLVEALDANGYLAEPLTAIARRFGVSPARAETVLTALQRIEPEGLFARSLSECLALQLRADGRLTPAYQTLLANLDLVAKRDHGPLARLCAVDAATLAAMLAQIKQLEPRPGAQFAHSAPILRIPELIFSPGPDGWQVALNPEAQPQIALNDGLWARLRTAASAEQTAAWQRARRLAKAVEMRNASLLSVGSCIAQHQAQALVGGGLTVLTRRMVSLEARLHETTVGRIVRHGAARVGGRVINLRDLLCRQGAADKTGSAISRAAVVQMMQDLRQAAGQPLSDSRMSALLAERGVRLARRTISKYRACGLMSN